MSAAACGPLESGLKWAKEKLGISHLYRDYEALLAHDGVDAVFVVTPTSLPGQHIIQALRPGKHVFYEKPLSLTMENCGRVSAAAALHPRRATRRDVEGCIE
jgi:myo-inositol 2-dehydrogenase / D-chiro-inositol 1-dehydrogenase